MHRNLLNMGEGVVDSIAGENGQCVLLGSLSGCRSMRGSCNGYRNIGDSCSGYRRYKRGLTEVGRGGCARVREHERGVVVRLHESGS